MGMHDGHRERLRRRYLTAGLDALDDIQVLEFLLFFTIPRKDTNPIAHRLLEHFGGLASVLEATPEELQQVEGVTVLSAVLLSLFPAVAKRHLRERDNPGEILDTFSKCGYYLLPHFFGERDEVVYLLCLDGKLKVRNCQLMYRGSVNNVLISARRLAETALACGATYVVLAHNHTSGIALPSQDDETATRRIRDALSGVGIQLIDHIVVANDDFVSMAESGFAF